MPRLPLATDLKTRTGAPDKDARLKNAYIETRGDQSVVRKRPVAQGGISVATVGSIAQGGYGDVIFYSDTPYVISSSTSTTWSPTTPYVVGDKVTKNFVDYWAEADNTNSEPPSADWSTTYIPEIPYIPTFTKVVANGLDIVGKISINGITWSGGSALTGTWRWIAYSPSLNLYVSTSYFYNAPNNIATSTDGINWTQRACPETYTKGICWSPTLGIFVLIVDKTWAGPGNYNSVYTSTDGINWVARLAPINSIDAVCWSSGLGKFAAVSSNRVIMSSDGIVWTLTATLGASMQSIVCGGNKFVAVGGSSGLATSTDGITWIDRVNPFDGSAAQSSVTYSPSLNIYVAIQWGMMGATVFSIYSADGATWYVGNLPTGNHRQVYWSNGLSKFITNLGYESSDGITWTRPVNIGAYCIGSDD
jgi:hypothetical protein